MKTIAHPSRFERRRSPVFEVWLSGEVALDWRDDLDQVVGLDAAITIA